MEHVSIGSIETNHHRPLEVTYKPIPMEELHGRDRYTTAEVNTTVQPMRTSLSKSQNSSGNQVFDPFILNSKLWNTSSIRMPSLDEAENDEFINPNGLTQAEMCLKYNGYYDKYIAKGDLRTNNILLDRFCRLSPL